jgi:hypothetical protein
VAAVWLSAFSARECGLTGRSTGAPTAGHQARAAGARYIVCGPGLASSRWRPVNSALGSGMRDRAIRAPRPDRAQVRCDSKVPKRKGQADALREATVEHPTAEIAFSEGLCHAKPRRQRRRFAPPCCAGQSVWQRPSQAPRPAQPQPPREDTTSKPRCTGNRASSRRQSAAYSLQLQHVGAGQAKTAA